LSGDGWGVWWVKDNGKTTGKVKEVLTKVLVSFKPSEPKCGVGS